MVGGVVTNVGTDVVRGMVVANVATVVEVVDLPNQPDVLTGANVGRGVVTIGAEGRLMVVCMVIPRDCRRSERSEKKNCMQQYTYICSWKRFIDNYRMHMAYVYNHMSSSTNMCTVCVYLHTDNALHTVNSHCLHTHVYVYHDMVPYTCSVSVAHPYDSVDVQLLTLITVSIAALAT